MTNITTLLTALIMLVTTILLNPPLSSAATPEEELVRAVQVQDLAKVKALIAKGADVKHMESDRPLLAWAAQSPNVEIVKALIQAGAEVDAVDPGFGETSLFRAVENQHVDNVKELLRAKANPNAKEANGEPVLARAVKGEKAEIVSALVDAGADVAYLSPDGDSLAMLATQASTSASAEIIRILGKAKADLNASNAFHTPLYYAADLGNVEIVKALLESGADANAATQSGRTPLYAAIKNGEITALLLSAKADPNQQSQGASPILIAAIENGSDDAVKALLKGGANVNVSDDYGNSALKVAQNYSKTELAELLKASGATE